MLSRRRVGGELAAAGSWPATPLPRGHPTTGPPASSRHACGGGWADPSMPLLPFGAGASGGRRGGRGRTWPPCPPPPPTFSSPLPPVSSTDRRVSTPSFPSAVHPPPIRRRRCSGRVQLRPCSSRAAAHACGRHAAAAAAPSRPRRQSQQRPALDLQNLPWRVVATPPSHARGGSAAAQARDRVYLWPRPLNSGTTICRRLAEFIFGRAGDLSCVRIRALRNETCVFSPGPSGAGFKV